MALVLPKKGPVGGKGPSPRTLDLPDGTLLVLTPLSGFASMQLTPFAARGLTQTYEVITGSGGGQWLRRDVNGWLRSVADTRFRKIKSTITCRDGETPCLDDAWIGVTCDVSCAFELSYVTGAADSPVFPVAASRTEGTVTYYNPIITMIVAGIKSSFAEWPAIYDWQVDLEQV